METGREGSREGGHTEHQASRRLVGVRAKAGAEAAGGGGGCGAVEFWQIVDEHTTWRCCVERLGAAL